MNAKARILLIEDEPEHVLLLKMRLEYNGYEVAAASDGEEGLAKAKTAKPDLILLDIAIPKINGLEVCQRLKADPETKHIPIIILTALGLADLEKKCRETGSDACIRKPFEAAELMAQVEALLKK